jgi:molecular chaperone GrpE (heat shock protein)
MMAEDKNEIKKLRIALLRTQAELMRLSKRVEKVEKDADRKSAA